RVVVTVARAVVPVPGPRVTVGRWIDPVVRVAEEEGIPAASTEVAALPEVMVPVEAGTAVEVPVPLATARRPSLVTSAPVSASPSLRLAGRTRRKHNGDRDQRHGRKRSHTR